MKKLILAVAILVVTGEAVSAQTGNVQRGTNKNCPAYVDNNKDGVCDNIGTGRGQALRNGNGQGRQKSGNANFNKWRGSCNNTPQCQSGRNSGRGRAS